MFKKLLAVTSLVMVLTGCAAQEDSEYRKPSDDYPVIKYYNSAYTFDASNQRIDIPSGFVLDQGHSYDIVETDNGFDIIIHVVKEK